MAERLVKSTLRVGGLTFISRILGFVRDMSIAMIFGAGWLTDAFFVAFKAPNFLRRLLTEGAVSHACLPILEDCKTQGGKPAARLFVGKAAGTLAAVLSLACLLGMAATPLLVTVLAPGFAWQGPQHTLASQLLQICWPYWLFITLVALFGYVLNADGRFALPAAMPILLNLSMIAAALWLAPLLGTNLSPL